MVSTSDRHELRLWTADDFLDWLRPGVHADLIDLMYAREGELLVEFAHGEEVIRSRQVHGFAMRRSWLDDATAPKTEAALAEVGAGL
jgi:hypothetical protein